MDSVAAHAQWAALSGSETGSPGQRNFQRVLISDPDVPSIHLQLHPSGYVPVSAMDQWGTAFPHREAMGRLRVAEPQTLFDSKFLADHQSVFWQPSALGGASAYHIAASAVFRMTVATAGDVAIHQTYRHFNYEPGKGQLAYLTGTWAPEAGVQKRIGLYDGTNGLFLQVDGSGPSFHLLNTAGASQSATQSAWNLDPLDGTGPSQLTLDMTKPQLLTIDFAWQGVGPVRFGFHISGQLHYAHRFQNANSVAGTYTATPNLPFRSEISSTSAGGAGTLDQYCATLISEGGKEEGGNSYVLQRPFASAVAVAAMSATVIVAARLNADHLMMTSWPTHVDLLATGGASTPFVEWGLILNPTIASAALTWVSAADSVTDYALGGSGQVATGGTRVAGGYVDVSKAGGVVAAVPQLTLRLGSDINGVPDVIALVAMSDTAAVQVRGALTMKDLL